MAPTDGKPKAGIGLSYKGIWGYCPLLITLANTKEVLYLVNRPGNVPSHQDAAGWIDKAIDLVCPHAPRVCLRGDTDFSLSANFDRWAQRVDFVFGMDANAALTRIADGLDESGWRRLQRKVPYQNKTGTTRARRANHKQRIVKAKGYLNLELNYEDVACFDYQPGKCTRSYKVVALPKNISRSKGEQALLDEVRYFFYITTYTDLMRVGQQRAGPISRCPRTCDRRSQARSVPWPGSDAARRGRRPEEPRTARTKPPAVPKPESVDQDGPL